MKDTYTKEEQEKVLVASVRDLPIASRKELIHELYNLKEVSLHSIIVNKEPLQFKDRSSVEYDTNYIQLSRMAYFYRIINGKTEVYCCKRVNKSTEKRLNDTYTILFGGHTSVEDVRDTLDSTLQAALCRELGEELNLPYALVMNTPRMNPIYTPLKQKDYVSNYHTCDVASFNVTGMDNITIKEVHKLSEGAFYPIEELCKLELESWSVILVDALLK